MPSNHFPICEIKDKVEAFFVFSERVGSFALVHSSALLENFIF